jgi:hypothetical protein
VLTERWRLIEGQQLFDMAADPGQEMNVADDNSAVVSQLRASYEAWFADVKQGVAESVATPIGGAAERITHLTCYDWHTDRWIAWQNDVRALKDANGHWVVAVDKAGRFRFTLRQQPAKAPCSIQGVAARLRIGSIERETAIPPGTTEVSFDVDVATGRHQLQTWFTDSRGAYYVDVERL